MSETAFATALDTLGTLLPADPGRDAIHLATYAVVAAERLFPGQHIGLKDGKASASATPLLGIVDPFLATGVHPDQMFWLVLYPRTITSLRHVWEHKAFEHENTTPVVSIKAPRVAQFSTAKVSPEPTVETDRDASERWINSYAERINENYDDLMAAADAWTFRGDYYYGDGMIGSGYNGKFEGKRLDDEFWKHFQIVRNVVLPLDKQENFFSCAC